MLPTFDVNMRYWSLCHATSHLNGFLPVIWGKVFEYNRLPIQLSTYPDEYQAWVMVISGDLKFEDSI